MKKRVTIDLSAIGPTEPPWPTGLRPDGTPKPQITVEFEPYVEPPEPPPVRCDLCDKDRPAWQKGPDYTEGAPFICLPCVSAEPQHRSHGIDYAALSWTDVRRIDDAHVTLNHLMREINRGKN